jgi:2-methylcitrate dehydratase PrpD
VHGGNGFWDYPNVDLKSPKLLETARRIRCVVAANNEWARVDRGEGMEIEMNDGRRIRGNVPFSKGLPENPLSPAEVKEKFHSLVDPILPRGRPKEIVDAVDNLESIRNIDEFVRLLVLSPADRAKAKIGGAAGAAH